MALAPLSALTSLSPYAGAEPSVKTSATQLHASFEKAFIDITTSDGDIVSLQRSTSHAAFSQSLQWQDASSQATAISAQSIDSHSFAYTVQGDLSPEELHDLGELFDTLSVIADDFFQGNLDEAMAGALNIGDMGSLTSLSATFSKTEITATQITSRHPYALADAKQANHDENALANKQQAQWKQIVNYLEKRKKELEHLGTKDVGKIEDHGEEMMARIKKTLERHQRLAPLIDKLAEKAISDQHQKYKDGHAGKDRPSLSEKNGSASENFPGRSVRI